MKTILPLFVLLSISAAFADEADAVRKAFEERDQVLREKIEVLEKEMAQLVGKISGMKSGLTGEPKQPDSDPIVVDVRREGLLINGHARTPEQLAKSLGAMTRLQNHTWVRFISSPDTPWARVKPALQACYDAGVWNFEFQVREAEDKKERSEQDEAQNPGDG
jgi:hypothetical protein